MLIFIIFKSMPIQNLKIVKKLKFLVASKSQTNQQIVDQVEEDAQTHRIINNQQEREDDRRVDHARQELRSENELANNMSSRKTTALGISVVINLILLAALLITWYLIFLHK
ncbi:MAG: hypothetical protein COT81_05835 [Candidatus Buchananbacteria bacterium CG10_big_fil_rev_8_21_14_0_10_42_9]|uniref:Uncharacterized protein n=1 Tax=Candidatus Buchananbacteria bacterium CG10_big_fil_rev_8_21_14_0_10_42_9 TaxID=1974526 RepID=A0A2H0VZP9_9BACT|nr:MAG: hypothetical protein COT81_05835 [Candidatus Buchananbacteria bacterium CG10_big_fil_rev_8_21_14_0_10_42_9]